MGKPDIHSLHVIRVIATLGIICFHFSCALTNTAFTPFLNFANGDWGSAFVTVFFMLSGALLYYQYADGQRGLGEYYYKRWRSIFPLYYIVYLLFEVQNIIYHRSVFFRGEPWRYIFTLLGMDGYLSRNTTTYYIMGEWFTGAIVMLYLLFPLLLWFFRKNSYITMGATAVLYVLFLDKPIGNPVSYWSITSCLMSFMLGMMLMKHWKIFVNIWGALIGAIGVAVVGFADLPLSDDLWDHAMGLFLFVFLAFIGEFIMKPRVFSKIFTQISGISYACFLLHHRVIADILSAWNPAEPWGVILLLVATTAWIFCLSKAFSLVNSAVVRSLDQYLSPLFCRKKKPNEIKE